MTVALRSLVADLGPASSDRWELVIDPKPYAHSEALGEPEPCSPVVALSGNRLAAISDSIDYVYQASHEIAEDMGGWQGHTDFMWMIQANILAHWCRLLANLEVVA